MPCGAKIAGHPVGYADADSQRGLGTPPHWTEYGRLEGDTRRTPGGKGEDRPRVAGGTEGDLSRPQVTGIARGPHGESEGEIEHPNPYAFSLAALTTSRMKVGVLR